MSNRKTTGDLRRKKRLSTLDAELRMEAGDEPAFVFLLREFGGAACRDLHARVGWFGENR